MCSSFYLKDSENQINLQNVNILNLGCGLKVTLGFFPECSKIFEISLLFKMFKLEKGRDWKNREVINTSNQGFKAVPLNFKKAADKLHLG